MKTLSGLDKSNLARTAISLLEHWDGNKININDKVLQFYMPRFCGIGIESNLEALDYSQHKCATSCCFVGFGPWALNDHKAYDSWQHFIDVNYGITDDKDLDWDFLFGGLHENDPKNTAGRTLAYLKGDPSCIYMLSTRIDYATFWYRGYTEKEIIADLRSFVIDMTDFNL